MICHVMIANFNVIFILVVHYTFLYQLKLVCFSVPPSATARPVLYRSDPGAANRDDKVGPYMENIPQKFTCVLRNVWPGKDSTTFKFMYSDVQRLSSKDSESNVTDSDESDSTKYVQWTFYTSFNRSDNGGSMECKADWKAGDFTVNGLTSDKTEGVQVICKL